MNALTNHRRLLVAAVATLAAIALPSSAVAGNSHLVKQYKVEKHVDLQGEDDTYTLTCPGSDLALDGMWRVDDVGQDNDFFYDGPGGSWSTTVAPADPDNPSWDVLRSVRPVKVASATPSSYDFKFTPLSGGDVQIKLWITCLGDKTQPIGGHTVSWNPGDVYATPPAAFSNNVNMAAEHTKTTPAVTDLSTGPATPDLATSYTTETTTPTSKGCPAGYVVTSPGFEVTAGDANLVASYPTTSAVNEWNWEWQDATSDFSAKQTWRCLRLKSDAASSGPSHTHRLVKKLATAFSPSSKLFTKKGVSEVQLSCGEHYKGLIGGWDYSDNKTGPVGGPFDTYLHFLGMDPRIKTRAFKFLNKSAVDQSATGLSVVCFKDKTT